MDSRERVILHSDLNNFFASVEIALHPEWQGKPLVVCGDPKERHGIVLAKSEEAKKCGIKTAETVYSALKKCPNLLMVQAHHHEYVRYSKKVHAIYERFTDRIEECSIDECALDVTESTMLFGDGETIAETIRKTVKEELGVTVSIGVSFNKAFAKLASELKKPDAVSVVTRENYREKLYGLPASDLMMVGNKTAETLSKIGIKTIGDLAAADEELLTRFLGKRGRQVRVYARGEDDSLVKSAKEKEELKSIGNSITLSEDILSLEQGKRCLYALAESVAARLREADVGRADTVHIVIRNEKFEDVTAQKKVPPTLLCGEIATAAYELFCERFRTGGKIRMLGITVSGFDYHVEQLQIGEWIEGERRQYEKKERAEAAIAKLRGKYGYAALQRGVVMEDPKFSGLDIRGKKEENITGADEE